MEISERGGELVLRPVAQLVHLEQRGQRKVFATDQPMTVDDDLTDADVRRTLEDSRRWPRD